MMSVGNGPSANNKDKAVDRNKKKELLRRELALLACEETVGETIMDCEEQLGKIFQDAIGHRDDERFAAAFLDQRRNMLGTIKVFEGGSRTRTTLYPRVLFKEALERNATGIVLCHNHPGGTALPSPQDRDLTRRVAEIGESIEVRLVDHLLVTKSEIVSFRRRGWI